MAQDLRCPSDFAVPLILDLSAKLSGKDVAMDVTDGIVLDEQELYSALDILHQMFPEDEWLRVVAGDRRDVWRQEYVRIQLEGNGAHEIQWMPSAKDRKSHPDLPADASLHVFLHEVVLEDGETLCLVTSLPISSATAAEHYSYRYDVEHDIRDIKVTLQTERIRARSVLMVKKELLTSIVAYNLVVQFRRQAADLANVLPRRLSFTRVWDTFQKYLVVQTPCDAPTWQERYDEALRLAAKYGKLPNRPKPRSHPRMAHPRRPKSTKFMKLQVKEKAKSKAESKEKQPFEKPK